MPQLGTIIKKFVNEVKRNGRTKKMPRKSLLDKSRTNKFEICYETKKRFVVWYEGFQTPAYQAKVYLEA